MPRTPSLLSLWTKLLVKIWGLCAGFAGWLTLSALVSTAKQHTCSVLLSNPPIDLADGMGSYRPMLLSTPNLWHLGVTSLPPACLVDAQLYVDECCLRSESMYLEVSCSSD